MTGLEAEALTAPKVPPGLPLHALPREARDTVHPTRAHKNEVAGCDPVKENEALEFGVQARSTRACTRRALLRSGSRIALPCRLNEPVGVFLKKEPLSHELSTRFLNRLYESALGPVTFFERQAWVSARLPRRLCLRKGNDGAAQRAEIALPTTLRPDGPAGECRCGCGDLDRPDAAYVQPIAIRPGNEEAGSAHQTWAGAVQDGHRLIRNPNRSLAARAH